MPSVESVKERDLPMLRDQYLEYFGQPAYAGDATPAELEEWGLHFAEQKTVHPNARLTRDKQTLCSKIFYAEETRPFLQRGQKAPDKIQRNADKWFDKPFKEPKVKERKQTIQMLLALAPAKTAELGGYPVGFLYETLDNPMSLQEIADRVIAFDPESKYRENAIARARVDVRKFNNAVFDCQGGVKPVHPYEPKGGWMRERKPTGQAAAEPAAEGATA